MGLNEQAGDVEAQAKAGGYPCLVSAIEAGEEQFLHVLRNTHSLVRNPNVGPFPVLRNPDPDPPAIRRVFHPVPEEIIEDLTETAPIPVSSDGLLRGIDTIIDRAFDRSDAFDRLPGKDSKVDKGTIKLKFTRFEVYDLLQIHGQAFNPARLRNDRLNAFLVVGLSTAHELRPTQDHGDR